MTLSAFDDKARPPTQADLQSALGPAYASWAKLLTLVGDRIGTIAPVWKFTSKSTGWGLRLVDRDRVILYMTPQREQFLVSFVLGERAVTAARGAKLSATIRRVIEEAPRYAEGRGVRIPIRNADHLSTLARLAQIKHEN